MKKIESSGRMYNEDNSPEVNEYLGDKEFTGIKKKFGSTDNMTTEQKVMSKLPAGNLQRISNIEADRQAHLQYFSQKELPKILIIATGGTLASVQTDKGYSPQKGIINRLRLHKSLYDPDFTKQYGCKPDENITPMTPFSKRIHYRVFEFETYLDSSNMSFEDQVSIAQSVKDHYTDYDGFVIFHGTDTMAYSSSTLSFILENLNKPVILTGSQIPILEMKNDAVDNVLGSLLMASEYQIPEVMIFFGNRLIRGNRARKVATNQLPAFNSPNCGLLGEVGVRFLIHWERTLRHSFGGGLKVFKDLVTNISTITMAPTINLTVMEAVLMNSDAVIIQAYGMGNICTKNENFMAVLKRAVENNKLIVVMSQCMQGEVNDIYATGRLLVDLGAVLAYDMTIECVYAKVAYLLGKKYSMTKVKQLMMTSMKGELTDIQKSESNTLRDNKVVQAVAEVLKIQDQNDLRELHNSLAPLLVNSVTSSLNVELMKSLANEGNIDFNLVDYRGRGPIHIAAISGDVEITKFLIKQRVNLDIMDQQGMSALYLACFHRKKEVIDLMVECGATFHAPDRRLCQTLLDAGKDGDLEFVKYCVKCDANLNLGNYDNRRLGHIAASENKKDLLTYLSLHTNFDFTVKDRFGKNTLEYIEDPNLRAQMELNLKARQ